jgi:hydrogenase nickel incorporation protein HypB
MEVKIVRRLMKANDDWARRTRQRLAEKNILCLNFISSPGSGKTTILENTIDELRDVYSMLVLEGDLATTRDADRIQKHNVPVIQLLTEGSCHLDASLVHHALEDIHLSSVEILFIENVGNLVCPAEFDIGESAKVAVLSVPEGDDKVLKYPKLFRDAACVILNKIDLLPYVEFRKEQFYEDLHKLNPDVPIIELSCKTGQGMYQWIAWLSGQVKKPGVSSLSPK